MHDNRLTPEPGDPLPFAEPIITGFFHVVHWSQMLSWEQVAAARNGRRLWGPISGGVDAGASLHVRGANGCGKTTFLRTLAGLRQPAHGRVRRPAGCWFLGHALACAEDLDALSNLRHWLALAGFNPTDERVMATLEELRVPARKPLRHLSAGQRRKSALALLALGERELWLLDEPFDALDLRSVDWLAQRCHEHLGHGGALVYTSHQAVPMGFPVGQTLDLVTGVQA